MVLRSEILVNKNVLPTKEQALPGRETPMTVPEKHFVHDAPLLGPFAMDVDFAIFGLGCFWGAERRFWQREGVVSTAVGYAGGFTPNPTYEEVCSGLTGHSEVVLVVYEPAKVSYEALLKMFWELHNPTQLEAAKKSAQVFQVELTKAGKGIITTEIDEAPTFFFAEAYHQQYLAKNPEGYCGIGGTGVTCPI